MFIPNSRYVLYSVLRMYETALHEYLTYPGRGTEVQKQDGEKASSRLTGLRLTYTVSMRAEP